MRKLLFAILVLVLSLASPAKAQHYTPGIWLSGGSYAYAAWDGPFPDLCCGRIFATNQFYGNVSYAVWPGANNAFGDPLQFATRFTNWNRSVGLEYVNVPNGGQGSGHITKFFVSDGNANFNDFSCWGAGCSGNNMVIEFCCVPDDGRVHAEVLTYNTYNPETSSLVVDGSWTVYPFMVYKGGQEQPFSPDMQAGGTYLQGIATPTYVQDSGNPWVGGMAGGTDFFLWSQWDTGVGERISISQSGNTLTYPFNPESGAQWQLLSIGSSIPPEDYWMGP